MLLTACFHRIRTSPLSRLAGRAWQGYRAGDNACGSAPTESPYLIPAAAGVGGGGGGRFVLRHWAAKDVNLRCDADG